MDEIDAIGTTRSSSSESSSGRRSILNELLIQLDGFSKRKNVIMIAATNAPELLDPALQRRFAMKLYIPLPDLKAREQLFQYYLNKYDHCVVATNEIDMEGFSGADIASLFKMAYIHILKSAKRFILCPETQEYTSVEPCEGCHTTTAKCPECGSIAVAVQDIPPNKLRLRKMTIGDLQSARDKIKII
jgi:SpoVK/Ycf46/Vps4 family AAA+-type ATPase